MKSVLFLVIVTLISGFNAHAEIRESTLDRRHEALVEKAVMNHCLVSRGYIEQVSVSETPIRIDQGIVDVSYEINLLVHVKIDQMMYDTYAVTVRSLYSDSYDHQSGFWGSYSIESVSNCIQQ